MDDLASADRMDGVVPVTVKPVGREPEGAELRIGDGAALRIRPPIQLAPYAQAGDRPRGADQVDDHGQTHQRLSSPVAADVRKQPMLARVPLACPRGKWLIVMVRPVRLASCCSSHFHSRSRAPLPNSTLGRWAVERSEIRRKNSEAGIPGYVFDVVDGRRVRSRRGVVPSAVEFD